MENLNSVCYVAKIAEIKAIPNADNIVQAVIGGWNCIIRKGEFNVNDLVVVATTDAVIPKKLSEDLNITNYLRKGERVRTVKLKGVYSECLIIPIGFIPDKYRVEGTDCMELMEIFKYEPPVREIQTASGKKIKYRQNPNFHIYYKFPNLKNVPGMFTEDDMVEISRKIHGTNARFGIVKKSKLSLLDRVRKFFGNKWIEYEYVYGSHNVEKGSDSQGFYDTDVWKTTSEKYQIRNRIWEFFKLNKEHYKIESGFVIYGEIYGPGIQKNYDYGLKELEYAGFDVTINGQYVSSPRSFTIHQDLGLPYVPMLSVDFWSQKLQDKYVFDNFIEGTKVPHEGIVIKEVSGDRSKVAKVINPDYLIYSEKHNVSDSH